MAALAPTPSVQSPVAYVQNQVGQLPYGPAGVPYLKLLSDITNGRRIDMARVVPRAQLAAIRAYTSTYDCLADIGSLLTDMETAKRGAVYWGEGKWYFSAKLPISLLKARFSGATQRGFGGSAATWRGTILYFAAASDHGLHISQGVQTPVDLAFDNLYVQCVGGGAGAFHGVNMVNVAGVNLTNMVVANFAAHGVYASGGYSCEVFHVYSAQNGNSNFYFDQEFNSVKSCRTDGGLYGIQTTSLGFGTAVENSHFEGATTRAAQINGDRNRWVNNYSVQSDAGSGGISVNGTNFNVANSTILGYAANTQIGLQIGAAANGYVINGLHARSFAKAAEVNAGAGNISGCVLKGTTTGLDLIDGGDGYVSHIDANYITGGTNSIKHTSGTRKWRLGSNTLRDGTDANDLPFTLTAGTPLLGSMSQKPNVAVRNSGTQSIPNSAYTVVTFDTEDVDTDGLHSTSSNTGRLTARVPGYYRVWCNLQYAANATGTRAGRVRKNGATLLYTLPTALSTAAVDATIGGSFVVQLVATEYVELEAFQDSGGALNIQGGRGVLFGMELIGDA